MSKPNTAPTPDIATLESEAFAEALEAAKTPGERLALIYAKQTRDEQRKQTEILGAGHRMASNHDTRGLERIRAADERQLAIAAERRAWFATVEVTHVLTAVQGSPVVTVRARLGGYTRGASEDRPGAHMIGTIDNWEIAEATRLLSEDNWLPHRASYEQVLASGDTVAAARMKQSIEGRGVLSTGGVGLQHRLYAELRKPIMHQLLVRDRSLEDLITRNACRLVGAIDDGTEPLSAELEVGR